MTISQRERILYAPLWRRPLKDTIMEPAPEPQQIRAVFEFMMFLGETLGHTSRHFEDETMCSPEETSVLRVLSLHGPLMVKEIAQAVPGMSLSKLTRRS